MIIGEKIFVRVTLAYGNREENRHLTMGAILDFLGGCLFCRLFAEAV